MATTHDTNAEMRDRAVLVSLITDETKRNKVDPQYSLAELVDLAETAGVDVLTTVTQSRETPDSKWFIGKGKVEELRAVAAELGATTAIFDQELSGAQVRNLGADFFAILRLSLEIDLTDGPADDGEDTEGLDAQPDES